MGTKRKVTVTAKIKSNGEFAFVSFAPVDQNPTVVSFRKTVADVLSKRGACDFSDSDFEIIDEPGALRDAANAYGKED